jgi:hypothetical protein
MLLHLPIIMATAVSFLAAGAASARGGGAHGGLHGMSGGAFTVNAPAGGALTHQNTGATSTGAASAGTKGAPMATPNIGPPITLGNGAGVVSSPNASNAGASPSAIGGVSPSSPNGGGRNNLGTNRNGTDMSVTGDSSPAAGTNSAGAALSSGLPTNGRSDVTNGSAQSADSVRRRQADEEADKEAAKVDRIVKSICKGC